LHLQQSVADTKKYMQEGRTVIYEAASSITDSYVRWIYWLKRMANGMLMKQSTTAVKLPMLLMAFQYYVITNAGIKLQDIYIVHLNNQYIRQGDLEIKNYSRLNSYYGGS
jgi:hypothetical protein